MAKKTEVVDLAIRTELDQEITRLADLVPVVDVEALEALAETVIIQSDEELDVAVARAGRALGWADKLTKEWDTRKQYFFSRYKAINAAIEFGVELNGKVVIGTARLKAIRDKFEAAGKKYHRDRAAMATQKQATIDSMVDTSRTEIQGAMEEAAARGDMGAVRELRKELETVQPVVVMERPLEVQGAAISEPCVWELEEGGMAKLVAAVAAGTIPLYHTVRIKGVDELRCIFDISEPVVNQSVRKMGMGLGWPGIAVSRDVKFAIEKRG